MLSHVATKINNVCEEEIGQGETSSGRMRDDFSA